MKKNTAKLALVINLPSLKTNRAGLSVSVVLKFMEFNARNAHLVEKLMESQILRGSVPNALVTLFWMKVSARPVMKYKVV